MATREVSRSPRPRDIPNDGYCQTRGEAGHSQGWGSNKWESHDWTASSGCDSSWYRQSEYRKEVEVDYDNVATWASKGWKTWGDPLLGPEEPSDSFGWSRGEDVRNEADQQTWDRTVWDDSADGSRWQNQSGTHDDEGNPWYIDEHNVTIDPVIPGSHEFTIVCLHSCSGGPDDFFPFFHRLDVPFRRHIRAVIPCSPVRCESRGDHQITQNSWYEYVCETEDANTVKHKHQLAEQRDRLLKLLEEERRRLPGADGKRLMVWGLSQGAALAVDVALHAGFAVGAVIALRGMALGEDPADLPQCHPDSRTIPVYASNGERDWLCPPEKAKATYEALQPYGLQVFYRIEASLAHGCARGRQRLSRNEMHHVSKFVASIWGSETFGS